MQVRASPLFIRADASTQIGTGHVMRCLALAQAWYAAGGHPFFAMTLEAPALEARLAAEGMDVAHLDAPPGSPDDAAQTVALARKAVASWVVVDGYHFDDAYQKAIKDAGLALLFVDDYGHASHYYADVVLNQNICADESLYPSREPYTRLLLGTQYALLRNEFWPWRGWQRKTPAAARRVLVTLGGSDPDNVTYEVIQALQQVVVDGLEAIVVVGGSNPHYEMLQSAIRRLSFPVRLAGDVTSMPELMAWADVAISAGGSTCWELAFMGLPNIVLVLADNQRPIAEGLDAAGVAVNLGWHERLSCVEISQAITRFLSTPGARSDMTRRGQELVDGEGGNRVVAALVGS